MANIIEKAFDISKNIVRTIFLGKPNLFTTSDLNRQIEAFKYQMDSIENRLGAESDMEISFNHTGSRISCSVTKGTYFRVNGLNIPLPSTSEVFGVDADYGQEVYFYVCGDFVRKTYTNDPTHEIAGAKFTDGTSMPAADQLVLSRVYYAITDDITSITESGEDFAFLIAKMNVLNLNSKNIRLNYKPVGSSVMMDTVTSLEYLTQPENYEDLKIGDDFNQCINKLAYKSSLADTSIVELKKKFSPNIKDTSWSQSAQGEIRFTYRIKGGMLHIVGFSDTRELTTSTNASYLVSSATFIRSDALALLTYFNELGYSNGNANFTFTDMSGERYLFIPLGSCSITGKRKVGGSDEGTYVYGHGEVGLMLYEEAGKFTDIFIGSYMTDAICFDAVKASETFIAPIDIRLLKGAKFTVNAFSAIIPLIA